MTWVIPPWLALVKFLGLTAKEYDEHDDNKATMSTMTATTATETAATPTTGMAATMETTTKVTWMAMVVATMTTTTMMSMTTMATTTTTMGRRRCDGDDDDGTTTMERRRCDGDGLASAVPPIRGNNQLMSTVWVGVDQKEGRFRGTEGQERGRGGSDWVEITSSFLDQFQINFPHTPEWQTHGILFRMCPGSKAALSAPW